MNDFTSNARWIWANRNETDAWWMFRRQWVPASDCHDTRLHITASLHYQLYINGTLVTRGSATSHSFRKAYDVIDIQRYIQPGTENVIAILAPSHQSPELRRGVLAELTWSNSDESRGSLATNSLWKTHRHASFGSDIAGRMLGGVELHELYIMHSREEKFDARQEPLGWNAPGFDDSSWEFASELGPANMAPFTALEPSGIGLLSNDATYPRSFAAIELARPRKGYRIRLTATEDALCATKIFMTEISCPKPSSILIHCESPVNINGLPPAKDPVTGRVSLPEGTHLFCVCQSGYYTYELEMLLETEDTLSFSAQGILKTSHAPWSLFSIQTQTVKYPWHESAGSMPTPPALVCLLATPSACKIPEPLRADFVPIAQHEGSVAQDIMTQQFIHVRDGYADQAIEKGQPRLSAEPSIPSPFKNTHNLLHGHSDATTILPTPGYHPHFIVDFGTETIGHLTLAIDAPAGTVIDTNCFEIIGPQGIQWLEGFSKHSGFRYVCREGMQTFTAHIRRGFRYVSVTLRHFDRPLKFYSLCCHRTSYPVEESGSFECSDGQLNQAYRMSVDTAAVCMLSTYVDCPGHEQSFWVGDARITALINLITFGSYDFDQRSIRLVGQSLSPEWVKECWPHDERYTSGRYLPFAGFPNYPDGGLPMWAFLWCMQCWDHWLHGGDTNDLKENYGYVAEMLRHCRLLTNTRGLFDMPGAWNLIEWGANDLSPYGEVTANNVLLVKCLRLAAEMARALNLPQAANACLAEADERQKAINLYCWDSQREAYVDTVRDEWAYQRYQDLCQTMKWATLTWNDYRNCSRVSEQTNTLAALCGCVPPERQAPIKRIVQRVTQGHFVHSSPNGRSIGEPSEQEAPGGIVAIGSPFFLFFSLDALFQIGEGDAALELIRREWGKMAAMGFRTCPESFGRTRSVAHAWSASPAVYLPTKVLGIRPVEPGYRKFIIKPVPGKLEWAQGSVATPHGPIHVKWRRKVGTELEISCSAPPECQRVD